MLWKPVCIHRYRTAYQGLLNAASKMPVEWMGEIRTVWPPGLQIAFSSGQPPRPCNMQKARCKCRCTAQEQSKGALKARPDKGRADFKMSRCWVDANDSKWKNISCGTARHALRVELSLWVTRWRFGKAGPRFNYKHVLRMAMSPPDECLNNLQLLSQWGSPVMSSYINISFCKHRDWKPSGQL